MPRHSFIQMSKLTDLKGRIDYVTNPDRQEHLYATYNTTDKQFWKLLAQENQEDFKHSGTKGTCIEARELIIALPESFIECDKNWLLQTVVDYFKQEYGIECFSGLHHNKSMSNYHIHMIFAERKLLPEPVKKIATRNMFFDEKGKHVRTKKEILNEGSEIRSGCAIISKGKTYETHLFEVKIEHFKDKEFLEEAKHKLTNVINQYVKEEDKKLAVFDKAGPYLPTKKIGKNNPKERKIKEDNEVILHLKRNHFVVMVSSKKNGILIQDPAAGHHKFSWEELEQEWSGYIITIAATDKFVKGKQEKCGKDFFRDLIFSNMKILLGTGILSLLIVGVTICGAYFFQLLLDYGGAIGEVYEHNTTNIFVKFLSTISGNKTNKLLFVLVVMFIVMSLLFAIRGSIVSYMSKEIDIKLINQYITKLYKSTIQDVKSRMTGEYLSRISDLVSVRRMISDVVVSFFLDIIMIFVSTLILIQTNLILFLVSLIMILLYAMIIIVFNSAFKNVNYEIMGNNAEMQSFFKESLQGYEIIKANNIEKKIKNTFLQKYISYADSIYKGNLLNVTSGSISLLIEQVTNIVIVFCGFALVKDNIISLGELLSFYMILSCLTTPVKDILSLQYTYQTALIALDRVADIQFMEEESCTIGVSTLEKKIESIKFEEVCFHYPGRSELLKKISFSIIGKEKIVIIGKNGTGKSTLVKLLLRFEKVDFGLITINNLEIGEIDLQDIRNRLSYVVQNNFLFADTIRNNITMGDDSYTEEEIQESIKMSGLGSFIESMPLKYDSYVYENGDNLSVGQKQAIAIARALIRKPQLLILDEATSNMDSIKEKIVIDNIFNLQIPCIIVTHNKYIIDKADKILTL